MGYRNDNDSGAGCIGILILAGIAIWLASIALYFLAHLAFLIGAICAAVASLSGIVLGIKNFVKTFKLAHKTADLDRYPGSEKYKTEHIKFLKGFYEVQPAKLSYIYDAGWYVMKYVSQNVWQPTRHDASRVFDWAKDRFSQGSYEMSNGWVRKVWACLIYASGIGTFIGGAVYYVAAFVIVSIFLAIQFIFTIIGAIVTSVLMSILGIGTYLFGKFYGVYFRCPECHYQMKIPTYTCRKCNQDHSRLQPSIYGVFYHTCRHNLSSGDVCNNSLPTLGILGRDKLLPKQCPSCNHPLQGVGGTNAHIPVVGAVNVGKSNYSVMATRELIEEYAPANNLKISFPNANHFQSYEANIERLKSANRLNKTLSVEGGAKGSNLEITRSNQAVNNLLYLYDTAGEDTDKDDKADEQETYFKYVHGIALVIDPLKIRQVYETYKKEPNVDANPEDQDLDAIFSRVVDLFEKVAPKGGKNKFSQPFAVIINKTDLCDLEHKIGSYAAREYMAKNSTVTNEADAINILVEEFLNENGERNFVTNLRSYFSNVRFFSCSALGSPDLTLTSSSLNSQSNSLKGIRVLEPMLWLMEQTKTLPNKASLGAKIFRSKIFVNYGLTAITSTIMIAVLGGLGYGGFSLIRWSSKQLQLSSIFKKSYITQSSSTSSKNNLFTTTTESGRARIGNQSASTPNSSVESLPSQLNSKTIDTNATVVGQSGMKNIRSAAGTNYSVVGEIPTGNRVQIISTGYDRGGYLWYQVYSPSSNIKGWMAEQLIKAD